MVVVLKMDWSIKGLAPSPATHIQLEMHTTHTCTHTLTHTHTHTDHSTVSNGDNSRRPSSSSSRGTKRSNSDKGPRVRTVLSEQQLQTLRTVYASNPRPDALLKEHLVEITQLSPRVIRVWFQNKRCKDKKKMIQAQEQARLHGQPQLGAGTTVSVCMCVWLHRHAYLTPKLNYFTVKLYNLYCLDTWIVNL